MKRQRTEVVCDQCQDDSPTAAIVTCEFHSVDLCQRHMRTHSGRAACRPVPVEREPTEFDRLVERVLG